MSHLLNLRDVSLHYGPDVVLDRANLTIDSNDKIALVGRNGAGKSTLLNILKGTVMPDEGEVVRNDGLRIVDLPQEATRIESVSVYNYLIESLPEEIEDWDRERRIERMAKSLQFDVDVNLMALSGGQWRRVLLAKALISEPDILLLDEPTNHLDIESIKWLEGYIAASNHAVIMTSHDRAFLQSAARSVVDLDRGNVTRWDESFNQYLIHKQHALEEEEKRRSEFDKKLAQEEKWIRKGIQARRTRNMGRVRDLQKMRKERGARRERQSQVDIAAIDMDKKQRSAKRVIAAENVSVVIDDKTIINNFSSLIERGDRIGIVGPNGCGKTTLIQTLLQQIEPTFGNVEMGVAVEVAYFDQHRTELNPKMSALDNVSEGREFVEVNGRNLHIMSYMQNFLFSPERARAPIDKLSGGERHRLLLAKILTKPFNLLVMDEPTNDLDVETLELLEEWVSQFDGTLLLISHDRAFLDNTITQLWTYEGEGRFEEHFGSYSDYEARKKVRNSESENIKQPAANKNVQANSATVVKTNQKLSFKEQSELKELPDRIEKLESDIQVLTDETLVADFYNRPQDEIKVHMKQIEDTQQHLDDALNRWEELEQRVG